MMDDFSSRTPPARRLRRSSSRPWVPVLALAILLAVGASIFALTHQPSTHSTPDRTVSLQATVGALRTQVGGLQQEVRARQTVVAQQQRAIAQLQSTVAVRQTPVYVTTGARSYLASFQLGTYSYVLYVHWTESQGFIRDGHLLAVSSYAPKKTQSFQIYGLDNNGSFGFTLSARGAPITFTGTANSNGTLTLTNLPWSIFSGFVGGTFTQTLHPGTQQDYTTALANLRTLPSGSAG
jgi:hypothetical protein